MTSTEYLLPEMPFGGSAITIVRWLKSAGDRVSVAEPLLVVVNERVEVALPAVHDGVVERLLAADGAAIAAGAPLAMIAASPAPDSVARPISLQAAAAVEQRAGRAMYEQSATERTPRTSPVARQIASIEGIDLAKLTGSGISGRIVKSDLLAALANVAPSITPAPSPQPPGADIYVLTAIEVDMQHVVEAIARVGPAYARPRLNLSHSACVALAAVAALACHPLLNSAWAGDAIVARRRVHLAVVPNTGAPMRFIRDAQDLNLRGLARGFGSRPADAANGDQERTFTIADLGEQVWGDPSALACGRSAALGIGAVRRCPLVLDDDGVDRLAVRHVALLTLAYDPHVLDQSHADAFLRDLKRRLERFDR